MKKSTTYAAFLLGINIGPHKRIAMSELKKMCENMGLSNVHTLLASGNITFSALEKSSEILALQLEDCIKKTFGFDVGVIVHTIADMQKMIDEDPFKNIKVTKNTRRYVTFYTEKPKKSIPVPSQIPDKKGGIFQVLDFSDIALYSVVELGESGTTDAMNIIGKMLGRKITTRNWNTLEKLIQLSKDII